MIKLINYTLSLNPFNFCHFFDKIKLFHVNLDNPDGKRKLHKKPIPLAGGIIIFLNLIIYFIFLSSNQNVLLSEIIFTNYKDLINFFVTSLLIFSLGFLDDKLNIFQSANFKEFKKTKISQTDRDALEVMGLNDTTKWQEIQSKFKTLVKKYHPDKNQGNKKFEDKLKKITLAYSQLKKTLGKK